MDFTSRRHFLQNTALLFGATALSRGANAQPSLATNDEDYWDQVRAQFSFSEDAVPMNAANLCPSFRAVADNVQWLTADIDRDCSFNNRNKFGDLLENARASVALQLAVSADEIALVRNTSEANNMINAGLTLDRGDEIILWDQNHPTNNVAWQVRAARYGYQVTSVTTPDKPSSTDALLSAFTSRFSNRTRVLAITHVSNVSGVKLPVAELVAAAHARGIYVHVDGAQTWGAMALNLKDLDVDSYSASAHKWYMGPKEVGLLYVKAENIDRIWPSVVAPGWGNSADTTLIGARKFESLGQRDDAALAGLGVAAQIHYRIGSRRIEARFRELAQQLKEGIAAAGIDLFTPMEESLSHGVCIARAPAGQGGTIANRLYTEYGIAGAATGGVRLCPTVYNTPEHINRAVAGLTALMA
ncbi:MAG: aminotransferase class V-fold PLP-dependent enzyme [Gammaproteobacteria bacterium]